MNENSLIANYCQDCGEVMDGAKCRQCGWVPVTATGTTDHQCAYRQGNTRCPLPGSHSQNVRGAGPWFCRWHANWWDDPKLAEYNLGEILDGKEVPVSAWQYFEDFHDAHMREHPEFAFRPKNRTDRLEFAEMCLHYCRHRLGKLLHRLPYDKQNRGEPDA